VCWKVQYDSVEITVLHVSDCPNVALAQERIATAAAQLGVEPLVRDVEVTTEEDAAALGFTGSPTVRVDGHEVAPQSGAPPSLACRLYVTSTGREGAPSVDQLVAAMRDR
jgi:hypothetical protein